MKPKRANSGPAEQVHTVKGQVDAWVHIDNSGATPTVVGQGGRVLAGIELELREIELRKPHVGMRLALQFPPQRQRLLQRAPSMIAYREASARKRRAHLAAPEPAKDIADTAAEKLGDHLAGAETAERHQQNPAAGMHQPG